jgi:hypothetical protein
MVVHPLSTVKESFTCDSGCSSASLKVSIDVTSVFFRTLTIVDCPDSRSRPHVKHTMDWLIVVERTQIHLTIVGQKLDVMLEIYLYQLRSFHAEKVLAQTIAFTLSSI